MRAWYLVGVVLFVLIVAGPVQRWNDARNWRLDKVGSAREAITEFREDPLSTQVIVSAVFGATRDGIEPEEFGSTPREVDRLWHEYLLSECRDAIREQEVFGVKAATDKVSKCLVSDKLPVSLMELNWTMNDLASLQQKAGWSSEKMADYRKEYLASHTGEEFWFDGRKVEVHGEIYLIY